MQGLFQAGIAGLLQVKIYWHTVKFAPVGQMWRINFTREDHVPITSNLSIASLFKVL